MTLAQPTRTATSRPARRRGRARGGNAMLEDSDARGARGAEPGAVAAGAETEDRELVARLRRGEAAAGEELVRRTYRRTYAALIKLCGDAELASDLTQEAYRRAWAGLDGFRGDASFATWMYRIAYTTFLNHLRRPQSVQTGLPDDIEQRPDAGPGPRRQAQSEQEASRLRRAVAALPEGQRLAVSACFWGDVPVREIARLEGVTPVAIRKRIRAALAALAETLGTVPDAGPPAADGRVGS